MLDEITTRIAVFQWLESLCSHHGDIPPYSALQSGVTVGGEVVKVISQPGIFKPRSLRYPISIKTSVTGPYKDTFAAEHLLTYKYKGTDPFDPANRGLRELMKQQLPLVYFYGTSKGHYMPVWPVYIVADNPAELSVTVAVDDLQALSTVGKDTAVGEGLELRRRYITTTTRRRLHQAAFRDRVLTAYRKQCAICRLRHTELLEAAHIIPDASDGEPVVPNGLSLCKIHHAAYDKRILMVRPDYVTEVRDDVLREIDGPMLQHGIKEMHGTKIIVPRRVGDRPDPERLRLRYEGAVG